MHRILILIAMVIGLVGVTYSLLLAQPAPAAGAVEYRVVLRKDLLGGSGEPLMPGQASSRAVDVQHVEAEFNKLGQDGWTLVLLDPASDIYVFQRKP